LDLDGFLEDSGFWEFGVDVTIPNDKNTLESIVTTLEIKDPVKFDLWVFGYIIAAIPIIISVAWFARQRIRYYSTTIIH